MSQTFVLSLKMILYLFCVLKRERIMFCIYLLSITVAHKTINLVCRREEKEEPSKRWEKTFFPTMRGRGEIHRGDNISLFFNQVERGDFKRAC